MRVGEGATRLLGDRSGAVEVRSWDRDVRVVLEPAGLHTGRVPVLKLSRNGRVALAAADDSERSECRGEFEVVMSEGSLLVRQTPVAVAARPTRVRRAVRQGRPGS